MWGFHRSDMEATIVEGTAVVLEPGGDEVVEGVFGPLPEEFDHEGMPIQEIVLGRVPEGFAESVPFDSRMNVATEFSVVIVGTPSGFVTLRCHVGNE